MILVLNSSIYGDLVIIKGTENRNYLCPACFQRWAEMIT